MEEELEAEPGLCLGSVTRIVLKTVGEHELHISDEVTCRLVFIVIDPFPDGAQSDRLFDDVIVVRNLGSGHQLHEGPTVFMSDQLHRQLFTGRQLMDAVVPPRGPSAGRGCGQDGQHRSGGSGGRSRVCGGSFSGLALR